MALSSPVQTGKPERLVILGIGSELNGDDAAGVEVVRRLQKTLPYSENILLIDAGVAPESFGGPIRRFAPDHILIIDAAETGDLPGTISFHTLDEAEGISAFTHGLPPTVFGRYIQNDLNCTVSLLLIQSENVEFDTRMGAIVNKAVDHVAKELAKNLAGMHERG